MRFSSSDQTDADVNEWKNYESEMRVLILVHMHQKTKIAPKIAGKIASVNRPLECNIHCV